MTALSEWARLIRMTDNAVLATSSNIVKWTIQRVLDKPGARSLTVPLGDPGDAGSGYAATVLADSPLAYWPLDESSGTTAHDATGNGHTGTLAGGVTLGAAGPVAGHSAMTFDGSSGLVGVTNLSGFPTTGSYSLECWVKLAGTGTCGLLGYGDYATTDETNALRTSSDTELVHYWWGDDLDVSGLSSLLGSWQYLVATYNAGTTTRTISVDGTSVGSDTPGGSPNFQLETFTLGVTNGAEWLLGDLAHVAIYATALTPTQQATHYAAATASAVGFAQALLAATGGPTGTDAPVPTLCELSLDGGTTIDARWMVEKTTPDLTNGQLVLTASNDDASSLYATVGPDRFPTRAIALADVLGGISPNIVPLSSADYGISTSGAIPGLDGLLRAAPGADPSPEAPLWDADASARVTMTGVLANDLYVSADAPGLAFLGVNIDAWEDSITRLITSLTTILAGVPVAGDTYPQGSRGHAVWCDSDVNLSAAIAGVVCDGSPNPTTPAGTDGYSNDATNHPTGIARALVIGNVGSSPVAMDLLAYDGSSNLPLLPADEATTARLQADQTAIQPDLTPLYSEIRLVGGTNNAGLATSETITCLVTLNNDPSVGGTVDPPWYALDAILPLIGTNLANSTGGVYMDLGDGQLRVLPSWNLALPVSDLTVDNTSGMVYAATNQGVYRHATAAISTDTTPWTKVGGLSFPVTRLSGLVDSDFYCYALVTGVSAEADGYYQYDATSPSTQAYVGYDDWVRIPGTYLDAVAVSGHEFFMLTTADQQANLNYYDASSSGTPWTAFPFPTGVGGVHVDRVLTASLSPQDSVWVATAGSATQPGYYLLRSGGWTGLTLQAIDQDGSLLTAVGSAAGLGVEPQINRAISLGYGINGVSQVSCLLCTSAGVYLMPQAIPGGGGTNWSAQANGLNGLAGLAITDLAVGNASSIPNPIRRVSGDATHVETTRLYAVSGSTFFYSYSDARYWRDLLRDPLALGPYFFAMVESATSAYPDWGIQTVGPMADSPIGADSSTHVQIASGVYALPTGWYWRRRWNGCYEPFYSLCSTLVPYPTVLTDSITEVAVTPTVNLETAAAQLAVFFIMLLAIHSLAQTQTTVTGNFTQQEAGVRNLWPTQQVALTQQGVINQLSSAGALVSTQYVDYDATPLYVLEHTLSGDGPLARFSTTLATTVRGTLLTGSDLAAAVVEDLRRVRNKGLRTKVQ